jgi:DNA-binding CsgD family transcriptional regulator
MQFEASSALVGRNAALSSLCPLVEGLAEGRGGVAWIEGEPGIGKSALIDELVKEVEQRGSLVLRGTADELLDSFPLRVMAECLGVSARPLDPVRAEIAGLLRGETAGVGAADPVLAAGERMLELVDRLCASSPVVLVVEDLHWADEPSLLLWGRLARAVDQIPLLLVGAARAVPRRETVERLRALVEKRGGTLVHLGPLGEDAAAVLAERIVGATLGPRLARELGRAGGSPLYVRELVDALVRAGLVRVEDDVAELDTHPGSTPQSLAVAIGRRLGFLAEKTRGALRIAALLGNEIDAADWALALDHAPARLVDLVAEATAGGVLTEAGGKLRFRHELIRQVLVQQTPLAVRTAVHGDVARKLAAAGRGVDSVSRHLLVMPELEDWALTWLSRISEATLYAAPQVSAQLLERATRSIEPDDTRWEALAARLAQVLFWLGRDEPAFAVAGEVARRTADPVLACRMRIQIMRLAGRLGRFEEALPAAVHPEDSNLPPLWHARLAAWSALILFYYGRTEEGLATAHGALKLATEAEDPLSIATARHALASCGSAAQRPEHLEAALAALTGRDLESMDLHMLLLANYVVQLADLGRPEEGERALAEAVRLADTSGTFRAATILAGAAGFYYRHGRLDEALVHLESIEDEYLHNDELAQVFATAAIIAVHRGDRETADAKLRAALGAGGPESDPLPDPPRPSYPLTEALALRAEAAGETKRALALMSAWLDAPAGLSRYERHDDMLYLVYLALREGDAETAAAAVRVTEADAAADPSPSRSTVARACRALVENDPDELLAVAREHMGFRWHLHAAFEYELAATLLAEAGDVKRARAALNDAVQLYMGMGSTWLINRADSKLRELGIRRGPRSVHRRATSGWEALTPSELRIAELVGQGRSNPDIAAELFLSRRTVQTHVSSILSKLQLRSRIDVIRLVDSREAAQQSVR